MRKWILEFLRKFEIHGILKSLELTRFASSIRSLVDLLRSLCYMVFSNVYMKFCSAYMIFSLMHFRLRIYSRMLKISHIFHEKLFVYPAHLLGRDNTVYRVCATRQSHDTSCHIRNIFARHVTKVKGKYENIVKYVNFTYFKMIKELKHILQ